MTLRSDKQLQEIERPKEKEAVKKKKEEDVKSEASQLVKEYKPTIPYPTKLKKDCMDEQFGKFLKLFK